MLSDGIHNKFTSDYIMILGTNDKLISFKNEMDTHNVILLLKTIIDVY